MNKKQYTISNQQSLFSKQHQDSGYHRVRFKLTSNVVYQNIITHKRQRCKSLPHKFVYPFTQWRIKQFMRSKSKQYNTHSIKRIGTRQLSIKNPISSKIRRKSCECSECGPSNSFQKTIGVMQIQQIKSQQEKQLAIQNTYKRTFQKHALIQKQLNPSIQTEAFTPRVSLISETEHFTFQEQQMNHQHTQSCSTLNQLETPLTEKALKPPKPRKSFLESFVQQQRHLSKLSTRKVNLCLNQIKSPQKLPYLTAPNSPMIITQPSRQSTISRLYFKSITPSRIYSDFANN